jgi:hypothetical protein
LAAKEKEGRGAGPPRLLSELLRESGKIRRVGKLAHGPLRSRCPRAAPNPFLGDYAPLLHLTMGHQSHSTGYSGSSTKCPPSQSLEGAKLELSYLITIRCINNSLLIPSLLPPNSTTARPPSFQPHFPPSRKRNNTRLALNDLPLVAHLCSLAPQSFSSGPLSGECGGKREKKPWFHHFSLLCTFARVPAGAFLFNLI